MFARVQPRWPKGYSSPAAFTVMFRYLVDVTPEAYRRTTSDPARAA